MSSWISVFSALLIVLFLALASFLGVSVAGLTPLFGVYLPYLAAAIFFAGVVVRILQWANVPVPFRIPTTCGQGLSLPWFKQDKLDCPANGWQVFGRMLLEVLLFRSLFRNVKGQVVEGPRLAFASSKWLWLAGILFHYSFLTIVVRHLRFFTAPVPWFVETLSYVDGFFEIFLPPLFLTDAAFLGAATFLFLRRVVIPQVRYISLPADYFALFVILGIGVSGVLMRQIYKVDLEKIKQLTLGLATFSPVTPDGIGSIFFVHLFLVCCLAAYFPFSKLMHAGGVFLSPTRNLASNNRMARHINPWNYPVKVHTYEEYEDEFRPKMKEVGLPVDKE
jgi:nitrate reductase gamma subunit